MCPAAGSIELSGKGVRYEAESEKAVVCIELYTLCPLISCRILREDSLETAKMKRNVKIGNSTT